ncbi:HK97 gp10 family phage protein [Desulfurobacterium sp.]
MIKVKLEAQKLDWLLDTGAGRRALSAGLTEFTLSLFRSVHFSIDEGKAFTPRTGHLQQSIHPDFSRVNEGRAEIVAGVSYAPFVEFGTRPHLIRPRRRKSLRWATEEGYIFAKLVRHPGSRPYPFFRTAIEEGLEEAKKDFAQAFLRALRRE